MKLFASILLSAVLASAAVYSFVSIRKQSAFDARLQSERAAWATEKRDLERALASAKNQPARIQMIQSGSEAPAGILPMTAEEIVAKLQGLKASSRDPKSIRRVIYHLEQLRELGPESLPAIRAFLARFEDVDYLGTRSREEGGGENRDQNRERSTRPRADVRLSFTTPPSLRLGLFDVLREMGDAEAEAILAEVLGETGRPVELAYLTKLLQEMAPNKHVTAAVAAAKDLLANPLPAASRDRLDEGAKDYLYYVLSTFGDATFASTAQALLVSDSGQLDRHALNYLNQTLKDQAMPAIYNAFTDSRMTNRAEKAELMSLALNYAGLNQQANEILNSIVSNESLSSQQRAMAVVALTRDEPAPEEIRARLPVVEALKGSTTDERVQRALDVTYQSLQGMLAGNPVDESALRSVLRGDRRESPRQNGEAPRQR